MIPRDWFDVIVIGSGFGGAVTACRLAEQGRRVLVLERGRRWNPADYPRRVGDAWTWNPEHPERANGWLDMRWFPFMAVAQGAGVGGGSLLYANVVVDAPPCTFERGWPAEITHAELRPFYDKVAEMLRVQPVPEAQSTERFRLVHDAARAGGYEARFRPLPLAVTFDPEWSYALDDPFSGAHSRPWVNEHGMVQGTCVHCGNCDIGCQVRAKNTLDLNYLARAERQGAEVRPLHLVTAIAPEDPGYRVHFDRLDGGRRRPGSEAASTVVVAAGSLGSTELLLRCRDEHATLPRLGAALGLGWSSNADFLTPARYRRRAVSPTQGPTITCAIDFLDGAEGERFFVEDGGFPNLLHSVAEPASRRGRRTTIMRAASPVGAADAIRALRASVALTRATAYWNPAVRALARAVGHEDPLMGTMPWFAQGIDAADGQLHLARRRLRGGDRVLRLRWKAGHSRGVIDAIVGMHQRLAALTGGRARVPLQWRLARTLVTPHPLGGCNMGATTVEGVVSHAGEVFGYPGLYVADGAIVPRALGVNPSKTIAALAERIAALMP